MLGAEEMKIILKKNLKEWKELKCQFFWPFYTFQSVFSCEFCKAGVFYRCRFLFFLINHSKTAFWRRGHAYFNAYNELYIILEQQILSVFLSTKVKKGKSMCLIILTRKMGNKTKQWQYKMPSRTCLPKTLVTSAGFIICCSLLLKCFSGRKRHWSCKQELRTWV